MRMRKMSEKWRTAFTRCKWTWPKRTKRLTRSGRGKNRQRSIPPDSLGSWIGWWLRIIRERKKSYVSIWNWNHRRDYLKSKWKNISKSVVSRWSNESLRRKEPLGCGEFSAKASNRRAQQPYYGREIISSDPQPPWWLPGNTFPRLSTELLFFGQ